MKILILHALSGKEKAVIGQAGERLRTSDGNVTVEIWDNCKSKRTYTDVKKFGADLLVVFDLEGFEQSTLTDGISYNLLDCKQIHVLLRPQLPNEKYLAKQLSISMFFYCADPQYCSYLSGRYPDIPELEMIDGWKKITSQPSQEDISANSDLLCGIIREVAEICHLR